jgi:hypothetical protein
METSLPSDKFSLTFIVKMTADWSKRKNPFLSMRFVDRAQIATQMSCWELNVSDGKAFWLDNQKGLSHSKPVCLLIWKFQWTYKTDHHPDFCYLLLLLELSQSAYLPQEC